MTRNQLEFHNLNETKRSNLVAEAERERHNRMSEQIDQTKARTAQAELPAKYISALSKPIIDVVKLARR